MNISFNNGDTGTTIIGNAGGTSALFHSGQTFTVQGQTLQNNAGDSLTHITADVPSFVFGDFIFGLHRLGGNASVGVIDTIGNTPGTTLSGNNPFLTITSLPGGTHATLIEFVSITVPGGFSFLEQPRISDLLQPQTGVLEPASLALLGSALVGFGIIYRRKRSYKRS